MSISENAAQLRQTGAEAESNIRGAISEAANGIQSISQQLQQARETAENSTNVAAQVLGEDHPATTEIVGAASHVLEEVERVRGLLSQLELELDSVSNAGGTLNSVFEQVANQLMGGGS